MFKKKEKIIIKIEGMSCKHCAKKVEEILLSFEGIKKVKVNLLKKEASITIQDKIDKDEIKKKIEELDYKVIDFKEL